MTATNHVLTGTVIATITAAPIVALPLAFLSHVVLDSLPHFDERESKIALSVDTLLTVSVLLTILIVQPHHWLVLFCAALLAYSPDFMWWPNYVRELRDLEKRSHNAFMRFHKKIQWGERRWGIIIELIWATVAVTFLTHA